LELLSFEQNTYILILQQAMQTLQPVLGKSSPTRKNSRCSDLRLERIGYMRKIEMQSKSLRGRNEAQSGKR
jgi:hypothetical protein